jgi:hypothetical protein
MIIGVFAICAYELGIPILALLLIQRSSQKKALLGAFRPVVDAAVSQCRNQT